MIGDELGEKVVAIQFRAAERLTASILRKVFEILLAADRKATYHATSNKMNIHQMAGDGAQTHGIEVSKEELAGFDHYAKKYHFKYSLVREENDPNSYMFIFKLKDFNLMESAARDFFKDGRDHTTLREKIEHAREEAFKVHQAQEHKKEKTKTQSKGRERGRER